MKDEKQKTKYDTNQLFDLPDENREAYGDGFPQDEASQGTDKIKQRDTSRPFDAGFKNEDHVPLTKTDNGESP